MIARAAVCVAAAVSCLLAGSSPALAAPLNDAFAGALLGSGDGVEVSGNTFGATKQAGEPDHDGDPGGASVWFGWTAPRSQTVYARVCTEGWKALMGIYRGDSVGGLRPVAAAHTPARPSACGELSFRATASVTYRIAIDGSTDSGSADEGNFSFEVHATPLELPPNDAFADATAAGPTPYERISGSTDGATREVGEPGHGGDPAGASVWFRWRAPESGPMRVFPCQASFRPTVSVYTGSSLGGLLQVSSPAPLDASLQRECQLGGLGGAGFEAAAGTTYSIAVDGVDGEWGGFQLRLLPLRIPFVDVYPPGTYIYKVVRLRRRGVAVRFGSGAASPGDTFVCKLDKRPFRPCASPRKWFHLRPGKHRIAVVATDSVGNRDLTPAVRHFKIGGKRRR